MKPEAEYLFEASWEVCNKVGGIYTVVKSKVNVMKEHYKNYFLIGPYFEAKAKVELESEAPPESLKNAFDEVRKDGIICHYGYWEIDGSPSTILIDFSALLEQKDEIKAELWERYGVDSLNAKWDFEEPMIWAWAVGKLLHSIEKNLQNKRIVGQFHEWLSGFAILYLKSQNSNIGTVFTTHATMLGRAMAGSGMDLYSMIDSMDPEKEAYAFKVQEKFLVERASAQNAKIFTTVSEITAIEAEKILGRRPEVILNNGLTMKDFPTIEETSLKHLLSRETIREFLTSYFFPYYNMELDHNLIFFIVGRYEFKNKGLDIMIRALGKLNERLRNENSERTISVFFWIPIHNKGLKVEVLENKNYYNHIKSYVDWNSKEILKRIVMDIVSSKTPSVKSLFSEQFLKHLERDIIKFKRKGASLLVTHNLVNEHHDPLMSELKKHGLDNEEQDKVKVIVYPVYLDGSDGLLNLPYYDAISGTHLGIFPSYYEPWGYTPQETAALGVPSITTDLAGFGRFIEPKLPDEKIKGIWVLKRDKKSDEEAVNEMTDIMYDFAKFSHEDRVKSKVTAKNLSNHADWKYFVENYIKAHNEALR